MKKKNGAGQPKKFAYAKVESGGENVRLFIWGRNAYN
jgi:hypothetical protein